MVDRSEIYECMRHLRHLLISQSSIYLQRLDRVTGVRALHDIVERFQEVERKSWRMSLLASQSR
jgi:hypothetical protein